MKTIEEYFESQEFSLQDETPLTREEKSFLEKFFAEEEAKPQPTLPLGPEKDKKVVKIDVFDPPPKKEEQKKLTTQAITKPKKNIQESLKKEKEFSLVGFFLGGEEFALPVEKVKEVVRYKEPTKFPGSGNIVKGIINLRGRITPVVDLSSFLNLQIVEPKFMLICDLEGINVGFISEKIASMHRVKSEEIEWNVDKSLSGELNFTLGILKKKDKLVHVLNLENIKDFLINYKKGEING